MIHNITVNVRKKECVVVIKTTFRLYRNDLENLRTLVELSDRIFRETKLEVNFLLRGDNKILHLTSQKKFSKNVLLRKIEAATAIIREVYGIPTASVQIQQGLF